MVRTLRGSHSEGFGSRDRQTDRSRAARLNRPERKPLHFRDIRHEQRVPYIEEIARAPLRAVNVLLHKPSLLEPETFHAPQRLYFYAVRYLVERVSWLCRDHRRSGEGDGSAEILFSNRSGMSYEKLRGYIRLLESRETSIDWSVVRPERIESHSAGKRMGLQIADAIASGLFKAVEPSIYGHTEDRYARMLKKIIYRRRNCYKGYGLKFFPGEVETILQKDERLQWFRDLYLPDRRPLRRVSGL